MFDVKIQIQLHFWFQFFQILVIFGQNWEKMLIFLKTPENYNNTEVIYYYYEAPVLYMKSIVHMLPAMR